MVFATGRGHRIKKSSEKSLSNCVRHLASVGGSDHVDLLAVLAGLFATADFGTSRVVVSAYRHKEHGARVVLDNVPARRTYIFPPRQP